MRYELVMKCEVCTDGKVEQTFCPLGNPESVKTVEYTCWECEGDGKHSPIFEEYESHEELFEDYPKDAIYSINGVHLEKLLNHKPTGFHAY